MNNEQVHRFEMPVGDDRAYIDYRIYGDTLTLFYVFVPPRARGRGLSARLIQYAVAFAQERQLAINPKCSYIARYLELHPELKY